MGLCKYNLSSYKEAQELIVKARDLGFDGNKCQNMLQKIDNALKPQSGKGSTLEDINYDFLYHKSLNEYYDDNIIEILKLRINDLHLENKIKILSWKYKLYEGCTGINQDNINKMLEELVSLNLNNQDIALVPYNIEGKHWVGLMISKDNNDLQVNYIDPENNSIPEQLSLIFTSKAKVLGLGSKIYQIIVEQQKYNNCGPEVIENFILLLTRNRLTQEEAVPAHSELIENNLLLNNYLENYDTEILGHLV